MKTYKVNEIKKIVRELSGKIVNSEEFFRTKPKVDLLRIEVKSSMRDRANECEEERMLLIGDFRDAMVALVINEIMEEVMMKSADKGEDKAEYQLSSTSFDYDENCVCCVDIADSLSKVREKDEEFREEIAFLLSEAERETNRRLNIYRFMNAVSNLDLGMVEGLSMAEKWWYKEEAIEILRYVKRNSEMADVVKRHYRYYIDNLIEEEKTVFIVIRELPIAVAVKLLSSRLLAKHYGVLAEKGGKEIVREALASRVGGGFFLKKLD